MKILSLSWFLVPTGEWAWARNDDNKGLLESKLNDINAFIGANQFVSEFLIYDPKTLRAGRQQQNNLLQFITFLILNRKQTMQKQI